MNGRLLGLATLLIALVFVFNGYAYERTNPDNQYEELGKVSWYRNYDEALQLAKKDGKDVLILFQEVPGCSTCRNYGHNVLTHPLMVEAIENLFVPLVIYNNKGGEDKAILDKYGEPSWNNPVVRIVNSEGSDVVNRIGGDYSSTTLALSMQKALKKKEKKTPGFLKLYGHELSARKSGAKETRYFKMYCFWSGEKHFGAMNGVLATEPGFIGHSEVVKVSYDDRIVNEKELIAYAKKASCTPILNDGSYRVASNDDKYYLKHTNYRYLPLTELQKTKINSAVGNGESGAKYLSPKQLKWLSKIKDNDNNRKTLYTKNISAVWNDFE